MATQTLPKVANNMQFLIDMEYIKYPQAIILATYHYF